MRIAFFPGCVIPIKYPGVEAATRALAAKLGIELVDADFHCCPSPTGLRTASGDAWLALAVANLRLAEQRDLDVLAICSGCGNTLREARRAFNGDEARRASVEKLLAPDEPFRGSTEVYHLPDLLARDEFLDRLEAECVRPLHGLKVATHYGCHYFRPAEVMRDDEPAPEFPLPETMELVLEALGAEIVEYGRPGLCCGAALSYNVGRTGESLAVLEEKLGEFDRAGADAIATPCPACLAQFDTGQSLLRREDKQRKVTPVYHVAELVACALGTDPKVLDGRRHRIKAPLLAV